LFKKNQQIELILYYEIAIKKNRKLKYSEWFELFYIYIINFEFLEFTKCLRRFMFR
jgi:hypothetical protein